MNIYLLQLTGLRTSSGPCGFVIAAANAKEAQQIAQRCEYPDSDHTWLNIKPRLIGAADRSIKEPQVVLSDFFHGL